MMLTASRAEPPPETCGTNRPRVTPETDGLLRSTSRPNARTTTATSPVSVASSRRKPQTCMPRMMKAATPASTAASHSDRPNTRCRPSAAPTNSARSVAIATASACSHSSTLARRPNRSRHSSGRLRPVASPALEVRYCTRMAIRLAIMMTHASS